LFSRTSSSVRRTGSRLLESTRERAGFPGISFRVRRSRSSTLAIRELDRDLVPRRRHERMRARMRIESRHWEPGAAQADPRSGPVDVARVGGHTSRRWVSELDGQRPPPHLGSREGQRVVRHEDDVLPGGVAGAGRRPHGGGQASIPRASRRHSSREASPSG
jgi:hypothetical protein